MSPALTTMSCSGPRVGEAKSVMLARLVLALDICSNGPPCTRRLELIERRPLNSDCDLLLFAVDHHPHTARTAWSAG